ncbi:MAG: transketolase C-terminal domain-containing protein, partial [Chloroflexota bacterium]|nr:transketolase C-terminal domain-containing protein [Chloroflexota bacterium]
QGFIPVVAIYSTFLQRAFDQILHDVCIQNLPVVFAIDRSGIVGDDGKTHQGCFDLSYLGCIPHLVICAPRDLGQLQKMLHTATKANCPVAIRYPRGSGTGMIPTDQIEDIPIGKGELLRSGNDITLIAIGSTVSSACAAADELNKMGIHCAVIDAQFAKPLDKELILSTIKKTRRALTIEEGSLLGGFGSAVLQLLQSEGLTDAQVRCCGIPDEFIEHGSQEFLRSKYWLDVAGIIGQVRVLFPEFKLPPQCSGGLDSSTSRRKCLYRPSSTATAPNLKEN